MMAKDAIKTDYDKGVGVLRARCQTYRDMATTINTRLREVDELLVHPGLNGQDITRKMGEAKVMTQDLFYRLLKLHEKYDELVRKGQMG